MRSLYAIVAFAILVMAGPVNVQAQDMVASAEITANGLTPEDFPRWRQITPGIYAYEDLHSPDGDGNIINTVSMIIVTSDGVVVADGQQTIPQTQAMIDNIKELTSQPIKYVVVASDHIDHVGGNEAFMSSYPDVVFISSHYSKRKLADTPYPVSETVSSKRSIALGDTEIEILNIGRGHTGGDLVVYMPSSKVLFLGELYLRGIFPAMRTGNPTEWIQTIKNAQGMDVSWYIPGHGFIDDAETMERDLESARVALEHVVSEAKRLHAAGIPCERAQADAGPDATCEAAEQADWGPYIDLAMGRGLGPFSVVKVYREIDGRLE
jgi:glyoxylase-like metal-dependent hydrolase (beta-lactamase superfamily II)